MKIAIEGCCHGELEKIYEVMMKAETNEGIKIDLLICCGDFQAVRNQRDLRCMAVSPKYYSMQSFHKYYSGEKKAPVLTIFIGGNHEASNHLWELGFGGWVAPNIYYLGYAGVVWYGGLRIAGLSGIYKDNDYRKSHFECPPYDQSTLRSTYHVRSCDLFQLKQLSGKFDIFLSHDWPEGIYEYGDKYLLLRLKPFFAEDMENNSLGSPPAMELLKLHRPSYWFSGHLHVKFAALYDHTLHNPSRILKTLQENAVKRSVPIHPQHLQHTPQPQPQHQPQQQPQPEQSVSERDNYGQTDFSKDDDGKESTDEKKESEGTGGEGASEVDAVAKETEVGVVAEGTEGTSEGGAIAKGMEEIKKEVEGDTGEEKKTLEPSEDEDPQTDSKTEAVQSNDGQGGEVKPVTAVVKSDSGSDGSRQYTKFLCLDKPQPRKRFLQILDIYSSEVGTIDIPYRLQYDAEWLAILKSTQTLMKYENKMWLPPHNLTDGRVDYKPTEEELKEVRSAFADEEFNGRLVIPYNFVQTVPTYVEGSGSDNSVIRAQLNPQTVEFCEKLGINNPYEPTAVEEELTDPPPNPDEIDIDEGSASPDKPAPVDSDENKESLGDGLLQYSVDNQSAKSALSLPPPINTPDDASTVAVGDDDDEHVQTSSSGGIKRALPLSPSSVSCDPSDNVVSGEGGPVIKRRNLALYEEKADEEEKEEAV